MNSDKFSINDLREVEKYSINKLTEYEISNLNFIDEINETDNWHPETKDAKEIGEFNFSMEEKILRWLTRDDTLYDVIIPNDKEDFSEKYLGENI